MKNKKSVSLNEEGREKLGHIFGDTVQVQAEIPNMVILWNPETEQFDFYARVYLVDWASLTDTQQEKALTYMRDTLNASRCEIREQIETDGHFALDVKWTIEETYDMRYFV